MSTKLTLQLDTGQVDAFCGWLTRQGTVPEQALAGLTALQTFLADATGPAEQATEAYRALRHTLERHLEATRERLLQEATDRLANALAARDANAVARVYRPLSRSGFWSVLEALAARSDHGELDTASRWASEWTALAKVKGEAASGYPDALDFEGAGISVEAYVAMSDVVRFLGH